jgi:hypothetical protein
MMVRICERVTGERTRVPQRRLYGSEDACVTGLQTADGKFWVEIEVISHSFCESDKPPAIKARGSITARNETGAPTVLAFLARLLTAEIPHRDLVLGLFAHGESAGK